MPVEIIGMIGVKPEGADGAAVHVIGGAIDTRWVRDFPTSTSAEGFAVTGYAAAQTERLGYLIAHRPGFVAPTATMLIRGFDPLHDALDYGRELIPLVRAEVARRDRDAAVPA